MGIQLEYGQQADPAVTRKQTLKIALLTILAPFVSWALVHVLHFSKIMTREHALIAGIGINLLISGTALGVCLWCAIRLWGCRGDWLAWGTVVIGTGLNALLFIAGAYLVYLIIKGDLPRLV